MVTQWPASSINFQASKDKVWTGISCVIKRGCSLDSVYDVEITSAAAIRRDRLS